MTYLRFSYGNTTLIVLVLFLLALPLINGCTKQVPFSEPVPGCPLPPDIFEKYGADLEIAGLTIGDFTLGKINFNSKPELIKVLSDLSRDQLVVDYLVCVAKHRGEIENSEQAMYLRNKLQFMQSKPPPTAEQIMEYEKNHPFPKKKGKLMITGTKQVNSHNYLNFGSDPHDVVRKLGVMNSGDRDLMWWLADFPFPYFFSEADNRESKKLGSKESMVFSVVRTRSPIDPEKVYPFDIKANTNEVIIVEIKVESNGTSPYSKLNVELNEALQDICNGRMRFGITTGRFFVSKMENAYYELAEAIIKEKFPDEKESIRQLISAQLLSEGYKYGAALIAYKRAATFDSAIVENAQYAWLVDSAEEAVKMAKVAREETAITLSWSKKAVKTLKVARRQIPAQDIIYFDFDQSALTHEAKQILDAEAVWLLKNPDVRIIITGHADERGTNEYNIALALRRAESVKNYLVSGGVAADRAMTTSLGEELPLCLERNDSCWWMNRRVQISIR